MASSVNQYVLRSFIFSLAFFATLLSVPSARAQASDVLEATMRSGGRTISVSGEGTARATPDEATVRFGIATQGETAESTREANAEAARNALNAARELVDEEDIRLETLQLMPQYAYDRENGERRLTGYEALRTVVVEIDDLEVLPTLVARVIERGANRLEGVQYDLSDQSAVRNEALREAAQDARDKAGVLAQSLAAEAGMVLQITEQSFDFPRPRIQMEAMAARDAMQAAAPEPEAYAPGEVEVTARVQVTFTLE